MVSVDLSDEALELARARSRRPAELLAARHERRDPLLRRMLALADLVAVAIAIVSLGYLTSGGPGGRLFFLAYLLLPLWLVLAKMHGLYDHDRRALRHLSVDELPRVFSWAMSGMVLTTLVLTVVPVRGLGVSSAVYAWLIAGGSAFTLRSGARFLWRRVTPPERTVLLGRGDLADAVRRKL